MEIDAESICKLLSMHALTHWNGMREAIIKIYIVQDLLLALFIPFYFIILAWPNHLFNFIFPLRLSRRPICIIIIHGNLYAKCASVVWSVCECAYSALNSDRQSDFHRVICWMYYSLEYNSFDYMGRINLLLHPLLLRVLHLPYPCP